MSNIWRHLTEVTPTLDTNAYSVNDRMGSIMTVETGRNGGWAVILRRVLVLDKDDQGTAFDIMLFNDLPTVASADNAAISITDAEMEKCVAVIEVSAANHIDFLSSQVVDKNSVNKFIKPTNDDGLIYALMVSRGTPTHTASGMVLKFMFEHTR